MMLLTDGQEGPQAFLYLQYLCRIFLVVVGQFLEGACRIHIVARIDTHLLAISGSHIGHGRVEVYIGHQWGCDALLSDSVPDTSHVLCLAGTLGGEAHQLSSGFHDTLNLCHACLCIIGVGGGHRLHTYRVVPSYGYSSHVSHATSPA